MASLGTSAEQPTGLVLMLLHGYNRDCPCCLGCCCCHRPFPYPHLLVVIEDDHHVAVQEASVVHGLVSHTTSDSSVTND